MINNKIVMIFLFRENDDTNWTLRIYQHDTREFQQNIN